MRIVIGASDGFAAMVRRLGIPLGSKLCAALIAACTSRAAPLISRSKSELQNNRVLQANCWSALLAPAMR